MIKLGISDLSKAYVGSSEVSKMYLGSELVYSAEELPISNGLLYWLDGKDIKSGMTDWNTSSKVSCIASNLKVRIATNGNTLHPSECLEVSGSSGGASAFTAANTKIAENPFYTASMSQTDNVTMECVASLSFLNTGSSFLVGGACYGSGSSAYYRYQLYVSGSNKEIYLSYHDGSSWKSIHFTFVVQANTNYHFVFQRENDVVKLYVNGTKVEEQTNTEYKIPIKQNCGLIGIGRYDRVNDTSKVNGTGKFYSQSMYNRALTETEIIQNYNTYFKRYNLS